MCRKLAIGKFKPEELARAHKHIERCDNVFDGKHDDGTQSSFGGDHEFAYHEMRLLALELLDRIEGRSHA